MTVPDEARSMIFERIRTAVKLALEDELGEIGAAIQIDRPWCGPPTNI